MIELKDMAIEKNPYTFTDNLYLRCVMPAISLNELQTKDTSEIALELGRELLEQIVFNLLKMDNIKSYTYPQFTGDVNGKLISSAPYMGYGNVDTFNNSKV